jgi:hypothetical protein
VKTHITTGRLFGKPPAECLPCDPIFLDVVRTLTRSALCASDLMKKDLTHLLLKCKHVNKVTTASWSKRYCNVTIIPSCYVSRSDGPGGILGTKKIQRARLSPLIRLLASYKSSSGSELLLESQIYLKLYIST